MIFHWPMTCPGLATHTLAGLCALWLSSSTSTTTEKLQHYSAKPQPLQTTCPAQPQHPVQALPHMLQTTETAFDLAVTHGTSRAGHSYTGRAPPQPWHAQGWPLTHWQSSVYSGCQAAPPQLENYSIQKNRNPHKPPAQPGCSTQCRLHHACCTLQRPHLTLQFPM